MLRASLLPIVASLGLAVATAAAAPSKRPPLAKVLRGEALASYEAARQDFKSQRYQQALAGFVRAHALSREPLLLWNAAACQRKLERNAEALKNLDAYLAQSSDELSAEELDEAKRAQAAVRELVATVRITTTPPGASISVDGTGVELAAGEGLYVEPGRHAFLFGKDGHQDVVRQEAFRAGETTDWKIALVPLAATVTAAPAPVAAEPRGVVAPGVVTRRPLAPWLVVGAGAAVGALGGVLFGLSAGDYQRLKQECLTMCAPARVSSSRSKETTGVVLGAVGAAAVVAGLSWWLFSGTELKAQVALTPSGVTVEGRF